MEHKKEFEERSKDIKRAFVQNNWRHRQKHKETLKNTEKYESKICGNRKWEEGKGWQYKKIQYKELSRGELLRHCIRLDEKAKIGWRQYYELKNYFINLNEEIEEKIKSFESINKKDILDILKKLKNKCSMCDENLKETAFFISIICDHLFCKNCFDRLEKDGNCTICHLCTEKSTFVHFR